MPFVGAMAGLNSGTGTATPKAPPSPTSPTPAPTGFTGAMAGMQKGNKAPKTGLLSGLESAASNMTQSAWSGIKNAWSTFTYWESRPSQAIETTVAKAMGVSGQFTPIAGRAFNIAVWATNGTARGSSLNGTVYLERSIDGGTTFLPVTGSGTELEIFTSVASDTWQESQVGVIYQLVCSAFTSGNPAINYYMSQ